MLITRIICCFSILLSLVSPALAGEEHERSYQKYFTQGVRAFDAHEDQDALRYFTIAAIFDPSSTELQKYLKTLKENGTVLKTSSMEEYARMYRHYLDKGIKAYQAHNKIQAAHDFTIALLFDPASKEADKYLEELSGGVTEAPPAPVSVPVRHTERATAITQALDAVETASPQAVTRALDEAEVVKAQPAAQISPYSVEAMPPPSIVKKTSVYVPAKVSTEPVKIIDLSQAFMGTGNKALLNIELGSSVILEGQNIKSFLIVDEGFITMTRVNRDRVQVDAGRVGSTFVHIWDDTGRRTLYIKVILPAALMAEAASRQKEALVTHNEPFRVVYSTDWSSYYYGDDLAGLQRQSLDFLQTLSLTGETPYGYVDASGTRTQFNKVAEFPSYTLGLSRIPVEGTSDLNLRLFDATRYASPLVMPGTRLRGVFADVNLFEDNIGVSVTHGQKRPSFGFFSPGGNSFGESYVDAAKITLFPKSNTDRYSFNIAKGTGSEREAYLTKNVYSVEGRHSFTDYISLRGEEARDDDHGASLASLRWDSGQVRSALNFRDIHEEFTTISTLPSNQGELGAAWTTDADWGKVSTSSIVDVYKDRLYFNPEDPEALNYDVNGRMRVALGKELWGDSDVYFVDTPGELSPRRSIGLNQRFSKSFQLWNSRHLTFYTGGGYQDSRYRFSAVSDYDRYTVITGVHVPLTRDISSFANYEYSWLHEPSTGGRTNPNVINAGVNYEKQFTSKLSMNTAVVYRDERGVEGTSSFLAGEDSAGLSTGLSYAPIEDVNIFASGNLRKVWPQLGDTGSYNELEIRLGMRVALGGPISWDPTGIVSGMVFRDADMDGVHDSAERGVPGVTVRVGEKQAITDKNGRYRISITARTVLVAPMPETLPQGLMFSTPASAVAKILQGRTAMADFGLTSQTGIYGSLFVDKNGNGVPDTSDEFVGRVKVTLDGDASEFTDARGAYFFRKVAPGKHTITVDINTIPLEMLPVNKLKNEIDVSEGTSYVFHVPLKIKAQQ